jgi:thymidylate synthase
MLKTLATVGKTRNGQAEPHDEQQYLQLIDDILREGVMETGRNGNAKTVCGAAMHFDLSNKKIPLLTTKRVAWKTCLKELLWFIKGQTDNRVLIDQNVGIWNGNASREFLDSRGLFHLDEHDLGPIYGFQWRHFNAPYQNCRTDYSGQGIDQLAYIIKHLKDPETRNSRRLIMSAWNPCQLDEMALPPCHVMCQFNVTDDNKLSCSLYQRSADVGLGMPFNIASYSLLTHLVAFHCGLQATDFFYHLGNCHIYDDHLEALAEQAKRSPLPFPTLELKGSVKERLEDYTIDDFVLVDYKFHDKISMAMRP